MADPDDRTLRVLLVEDSDVDVMAMRRSFRRTNLPHDLLVFGTGEEALAYLREKPRERLVLLDLNLPGISGLETLRSLRDDPALRSTAVVVLTTSDADRDKVEAFDLNVAGYLLKPVEAEELSRLVTVLHEYWTSSELPLP
jgi:CheY-like chemotaxis protein